MKTEKIKFWFKLVNAILINACYYHFRLLLMIGLVQQQILKSHPKHGVVLAQVATGKKIFFYLTERNYKYL